MNSDIPRQADTDVQIEDPYFTELKEKSSFSFDYVLWFYRILKYWYVFAISIPLFLGIAYLKNKSWVPVYNVRALIMLEQRGNAGGITGTVPMGSVLKNTENQRILLSSYGMTKRTVDRLPQQMYVQYYWNDRFKRNDLYAIKPVMVDSIEFVRGDSYRLELTMTYIDDTKCLVSYPENKEQNIPSFELVVPFDEIVECDRFKARFVKARDFHANFKTHNFMFLNKGDLIGMYGQVGANLVHDESTAMYVNTSDIVPSRAIDYLTVLLDAFKEESLRLKNEQADITISFIDTQLQIINDSLMICRKKLSDFENKTGIYDVLSPQLRGQSIEADKARDELYIQEKMLLFMTERINDAIVNNTAVILPLSLDEGSKLGKLGSYISDYNMLISKFTNMGEKHPMYGNVLDEIVESRENLLKALKLQQVELKNKKNELVNKYKDLELQIENLPSQERDFIFYKREYATYEMYEQYLSQKKQEASLEKASNMADNYVWEEPRLMGGAVNGKEKSDNTMFYLIIGVLLPLAFIVLKEELLNITVSSKDECEKLSGLPVIGTIENVSKRKADGAILVRNFPKSSFAESFRNMRIRIEYMARKENHVSVLVTSTEPADGKTFVATNIASVYQMMGKKVVLLDLDLRRPSVAKSLNLKVDKGVSNYLIGQVELDDIIIKNIDYGFDIITAGTLPPNPSELIKTDKTKELLNILREKYDYVIVDCSPVGLVSDAYVLSKLVDTTLYVVRRAKTNKSFFKSVIRQMHFDGVTGVGLVFNDVKQREGYYGTSRYYGNKTSYLKRNAYYNDDYYEN